MAESLDKILDGQGLTLIPHLHLQQIDLFLWRKGIELYPLKDNDRGDRSKFLAKCWHHNRTALYLSDIWERGAKTGSVLLYTRPDGMGGYGFAYYQADEFEPSYTVDGVLQSVTITTVYGNSKHYKLIITPVLIQQWEGDRPMSDTDTFNEYANLYGFIPCAVIDNRPTGPGRRGKTEFCDVQNQIEAHDLDLEQIHDNFEFYGDGIFYSSRSRSEMVDADLVGDRGGVAERSGFRSSVKRRQERVKARRVVDNIESDEVPPTFVQPPVIPVETMLFIKRFAEEIRTALGGVAETTNLFERLVDPSVVKVVMARAICTADRRADSYLTYGICAAYENILRMAEHDGLLPAIDGDRTILYRYLGDVFQDTPQDTLTKSIVSRNQLRMGVNVRECIRYLFPDKRDAEIDVLLKDGFAYEFLNGIATVAKTLVGAKDSDGRYAIDIQTVIQKVLTDGNPDFSGSNSRQSLQGSTGDDSSVSQAPTTISATNGYSAISTISAS